MEPDNPPNTTTNSPSTTKPPYFCPTCSVETKPNQKYKHLKKHAQYSHSLKTITTSIESAKTEIQFLKNELKKYEILNTEKQKELAVLELAVLKELIN